MPSKHNPFKIIPLGRGGLRLMRTGEIELARQLYKYSIHYERVWIHHDSFLPFGIQGDFTAMTPAGEIWFEQNVYQDDFATASVNNQHLLMHELMHVWQAEQGMNVILRGLASGITNYHYTLDNYRLSDYSMEQQASIVSDYWLLKYHGFSSDSNVNLLDYQSGYPQQELTAKYEKILGSFPY